MELHGCWVSRRRTRICVSFGLDARCEGGTLCSSITVASRTVRVLGHFSTPTSWSAALVRSFLPRNLVEVAQSYCGCSGFVARLKENQCHVLLSLRFDLASLPAPFASFQSIETVTSLSNLLPRRIARRLFNHAYTSFSNYLLSRRSMRSKYSTLTFSFGSNIAKYSAFMQSIIKWKEKVANPFVFVMNARGRARASACVRSIEKKEWGKGRERKQKEIIFVPEI